MKILCPSCERLLPLGAFRLEGATLVVTCAGCNVETRVERTAPAPVFAPSRPVTQPPRVSLASTEGGSNVVVLRTAGHDAVSKAAAAADAQPFAVPDDVCPRCIAPKAQAAECPHCGISFERYQEAMTMPPRWLRDDWVALLRDWGNEAKHLQLRRKAQQLDGLAAVGRLYRLRLAWVPEDPFALEGRADVLRLAAVAISLTRPGDDELSMNPRRKNVLLGLGGFAVIVLALITLRMLLS
ncbi:MAG: hypothetical protein ACO1OB_15155 [Archangium sp.]